MSIQEKRRANVAEQIDRLLAARETLLGRLMGNERKLVDARRRIRRYDRIVSGSAGNPPQPCEEPKADLPTEPTPPPAERQVVLGDGIPDFLIRKQILQQQEQQRLAKARNRIATMKAKQRGELKRMPLQGKAALDYIDAG